MEALKRLAEFGLPVSWIVRLVPVGTWLGLFTMTDQHFATAFVAVLAATVAMWDMELTMRISLSLSRAAKKIDDLEQSAINGGGNGSGSVDHRHPRR